MSQGIRCEHSIQSWSKDMTTEEMHCDDCDCNIEQGEDGFWYRKRSLSPEPARTLTDRECTRLIGAFIGGLCEMAPIENVERAIQWWASTPEAWEYLRKGIALAKAVGGS